MSDQSENRFTWVYNNFSSSQYVKVYSLPFTVAGCHWRLSAYMNGGYLCICLEVAFPKILPPFWSRQVKFSLTLANKALGKSHIVWGTQCIFDARDHKGWGHKEFVSFTKLHDKDEGFLVNDQLVIVADIFVYPVPIAPQDLLVPLALVAPEESVKISEPLSKKGDQASDASPGKSSYQMVQKTENASKESLDGHDISKERSDDDDTSEESSDDDSSSSVSDDGARDKVKSASFGDTRVGFRPKNQKIVTNYMNELDNFLKMVFKLPEKLAEEDLSNAHATLVDMIKVTLKLDTVEAKLANDPSKSDEAIKNLPALQLIGGCKCPLTKGNLDASESSNLLNEASAVKETIDVNGFQVLPSQEKSVRRIFEKHPDIALEFRGKNQHLRKACMSFLLSLIETLCQSLEELSTDDLVEADIALTYLKDAGFKVDWLEKKLEQVVEKKQKEESGLAKLKETEENLVRLKLKCAELDALAEAQKAELSATRTPLSLGDVLF